MIDPTVAGDGIQQAHEARILRRRSFLAAAAAGVGAGALMSQLSLPAWADDPQPNQAEAPASDAALDFSRSYMHCAPNTTGIWVRIRIECFCELTDRSSGASEQYALGVVAKTGLNKNPATGALLPGYDYWLIFTKDHIYTRRTHATVYCRNPTVLTAAEFGPIGWHLAPAAGATPLNDPAEVRKALEGWRRIVARTEFTSSDGNRTYSIRYPVKWADCGTDKSNYRVETGPVVLLDPDKIAPGQSLQVADFQWAHLDFHSADRIRCLLDRPTSILSEAAFFPPKEDKREARQNPALTSEQVKAIEDRLFSGWEPPIPVDKLRELFQTDHYSDAVDRPASNKLWAID